MTFLGTLRELFSVIRTPYILWSVFPSKAESLLQFIVDNTVDEPSLGHICRFAALRVDRDGDPNYHHESQRDDGGKKNQQNGKLESSLLNFCGHYPQFRPDERTSFCFV